MAPGWLTTVAWIYLGLCFSCAGIAGYDIAVNKRLQPMGVMNFVFPITALYFGPLALWFYFRWGRAGRSTSMSMTTARAHAGAAAAAHVGGEAAAHPTGGPTSPAGPQAGDPPAPERGRPGWVAMATEVSHCGAGWTLGDMISEFVVFALALAIAGSTLAAEYTGDYVLALAFGVAFQYSRSRRCAASASGTAWSRRPRRISSR